MIEEIFAYLFCIVTGIFALVITITVVVKLFLILRSACFIEGHDWELIESREKKYIKDNITKAISNIYIFKCKRCGKIKKMEIRI